MPKNKVFCTQLKGEQKFLRLFGESSKPYGLASGLVTLKSKESVGLHNTQNKEEALIILQGQAQVSYGKRSRIKVGKNCFVYIPPKTVHDLKNIGKGILQYVYLTACIK
ncbi:MAG: cupin domain-containing protein [Candidatus Omnitrophica bacterium]|nr:cupin domain-containing protein [Candidatus Omnitrophota bacterium]MBU1923960.1 cupin domain-containing protein [Candidatus Omnitrophota bacterium]